MGGRIDTCMCMAESLLCAPETITTLLIGYKGKVLVAQSCLTLCNPTACRPQGSSVHGILQARIPEWVAIAPPGDLTPVQNILILLKKFLIKIKFKKPTIHLLFQVLDV